MHGSIMQTKLLHIKRVGGEAGGVELVLGNSDGVNDLLFCVRSGLEHSANLFYHLIEAESAGLLEVAEPRHVLQPERLAKHFCGHLAFGHSANPRTPGLVNFVTAVAYHFCLNLPRAFLQPGKNSFGDPCTGREGSRDK